VRPALEIGKRPSNLKHQPTGWRSRPSLSSCVWERRALLYTAVSTASPPEYQSRRVLIDVFDRLVQLGKGTAPIDGEGLELLEAGIGKAREPGRDLVRALVEIFRELANCVGGLGDLTAAVAASAADVRLARGTSGRSSARPRRRSALSRGCRCSTLKASRPAGLS
jgi:hypothetical protein